MVNNKEKPSKTFNYTTIKNKQNKRKKNPFIKKYKNNKTRYIYAYLCNSYCDYHRQSQYNPILS